MKILWLDNDPKMSSAICRFLEGKGHEVILCSQIESFVKRLSSQWDRIILDVMIPFKTDDEASMFSENATNGGAHTGLALFQWMKAEHPQLAERVFVYTVRRDEKIKQALVAEGLQERRFRSKSLARTGQSFLDWIKE